VGIWEIPTQPKTYSYNSGNVPNNSYTNEFQIRQATKAVRAPYAAYGNVGSTASGDITFTTIPAGSALATNNASLGAGYPILLGTTHGSAGGNVFNVPWVASNITAITTAMNSAASAQGDSNTYAPTVVSLTGYSSY
jgi:hypothetical protein